MDQLYTGPIRLETAALVKARARSSNGEWSALTEAAFASSAAVVAGLRISEVMYHPDEPRYATTNTADDFEFIELTNIGSQPVDLRHTRLDGAVRFTFPPLLLGPGEFTVVVRKPAAFAERYDTNQVQIAGVYEGALNNDGERLRLLAPGGVILADFRYNDGRGWPLAADGAGHSLVPLVMDDQAGGALDYGGNWRASTFIGGSPGAPDPPPWRDVAINELAAHTDYTNPAMPEYTSNDWLELFNVSNAPIRLEGWYLSDSRKNLRKWAIPITNSISPGGFLSFDEVTGFHCPITNGFGLNKSGERLYLSYLPEAGPGHVADCLEFDAQENGVSLGRYPDGGPGWFQLIPIRDAPNRRAGSPEVIISEVMYHPPARAGRAGDNTCDEYVEIANLTTNMVPLWNEAGVWRITGGIEYSFPAGTVLGPRQYLIVVPFNSANSSKLSEFLQIHGLTAGEITVLGPYAGKLSNRGGRLVLQRPQTPDSPGDPVSWVTVDEVIYSDQPPWPATADGGGFSLQRVRERGLGTDPETWSGMLGPTPGQPRAKLALTAPPNGAVFLLPFAAVLTAAVDHELVVGQLRAVEFWRNETLLGVSTGSPAVCLWEETEAAGSFTVKARLIDDEGTNISHAVTLRTLAFAPAGPPEDVTDVSARARGRLVGEGEATIFVYWGETDGGTNRDAWTRVKTLGVHGPGEFLFDLTGLEPNRQYYYRCFAQTASGSEGWAPTSHWFITPGYQIWSHQMKISFPGYIRPTVLSNFPALIVFSTNIPGFSYQQFGYPANGADLRFSDATGNRPLNFEIESWNPNGDSQIWVQVPRLASSNDYIYAFWGNRLAVAPPPSALNGATWDASFRAVCHLNGNAHDATPNETEAEVLGTTNAAGVVGKGRRFDGIDDAIISGIHHRWFGANICNLTISCWVNPSSTGPGCPFGTEDTDFTNRFFVGNARGGYWQFWVQNLSANGAPVMAERWQLLTLILDQNRAYGCCDNKPPVFIGTYEDFEPPNGLVIGGRAPGTLPFAGVVDELRVSQVARPEDWIWAEYMTVASNCAFTSYALIRNEPQASADTDGDGLPDEWEREQFGGINAEGGRPEEDWDNDGMNNWSEYMAGTSPTSTTANFQILFHRRASDRLEVGVATVPTPGPGYYGRQRRYALESASDLKSGIWTGVSEMTNLPATGEIFWHTNGQMGTPALFYRGKVWLENQAQ